MFSRRRGQFVALISIVTTLMVGSVTAPAWAQPIDSPSAVVETVSDADSGVVDESPEPTDLPTEPESSPDTPDDDTYVGSSTTSSELYGTSGQIDVSAADPPSDPGGDAQAPPPKADAQSASTEEEASAIAQQHDHNVVVDTQTTETTLVEALPDGTFQLTSSSVPARVKRDDSWVDVDTTLSATEEYFTPAATIVPVRFSDGGTGPIAQIQLPDGDWFSESWQLGELPTPAIDGAVALYGSVIPDVDLQLTATATGMTEVIIVHTPEAAADPRLEVLRLTVSGAALAQSDSGAVVAAPTDAAEISRARGRAPTLDVVNEDTMLVSSDPQIWDSTNPDAGPGGPGGNSLAVPADTMVNSDNSVAIDVSSAMSSDVKYPLYIDPDWGSGNIQAWSINQTYPNTHYWNVPDDSDGRGNQVVGFLPEGWTQPYPGDGLQQWGRSFWQLSTAGSAGKHILRATFNVRQSWNSSCNSTAVRLFRATNIPSAGASWNESTGVIYNGPSDVVSTNYGSNCAGQNWVGLNATQAVSDNGNGQAIILALAANDETHESWKRFNLDASLVVNYNTPPSDPTNLVMQTPPRVCGTMSDPAYINPDLPFTLAATISDPDPASGGVEGRFRIMPYNNGAANSIAALAPNGYLSGGNHTSGSVQSVQLPVHALPTDGFFAWGVTAWDSYDNLAGGEGHDRSTGEPLCFFKTKSSTPALPTIAKVSSGDPVVGQSMTVKFTSLAADAVMGYEYWWTFTTDVARPELPIPGGNAYTGPNGTLVNTALPGCTAIASLAHVVCLPQGSLSITVPVAPLDKISTLWVASFDKAGNVSRNSNKDVVAAPLAFTEISSDTTNVTFGTATAHPTAHAWRTGKMGTGEQSLTTVPTNVPDEPNVLSPTTLNVAAGFPQSLTATIPTSGAPTIPVFQDVGGIALNRINNGNHAAVSAGQIPAGYTVESQLGQLAPIVYDEQNLPTGPTGTHLIYECKQSNGYSFTTASATCSGAVAAATTLGYIWESVPPAIVTGQSTPSVHIYRCTNGNDHFDSVDANCEGYGAGIPLGYLRNLTRMQTTATTVDTRKSFTVSAWVKPDQLPGLDSYNTIVSQSSGGPNSSFVLQEKKQTDANGRQFRFCIRNQVGAAVVDCAVQPSTAANGEWVFLTGIWDAVNQQLRLTIGSSASPVASTTHVVPAGEVTGSAPLSVGSGFANGCRVNMWLGSIANVTIFQGVASSNQLNQLFRLKPPNG